MAMDMAPEIADKIVGLFKKNKTEEELAVAQAVEEASKPITE